MDVPRLIGVIHLGALPGSPRFAGSLDDVVTAAAGDAAVLAEAGFEAAIVENFGDAPFVPGPVEPVTIAAMTRCALAVREVAPALALGVNVLRNDARTALAIAAASGASFIRVNVHTGARLTDQGVIEGRAHETLRERRALGLERVALLCDVAVKHSAALAPRPIAEEARELWERGLADAVLVTGAGTAEPANPRDLEEVLSAVGAPVLIASGAQAEALGAYPRAHGFLVGSSLRASGRAGDPIDRELARAFASAFVARRAL